MTPYIQQQLKKLCDNPNWYDDMLISWDKNPRNQREAIYNYLSHVQLNGLLENTQIVFTFIDGDMKPAFISKFPEIPIDILYWESSMKQVILIAAY